MPREIRPVTAAILKNGGFFPYTAFTVSDQFTVLLSFKVVKPPNSINENFKISNYENKLVISKMAAIFKMAAIKLREI